MVASKRLPASFDVPESMALPLYQSRARVDMPLVAVVQETRTDARIAKVAPEGAAVGALSASVIVSSTAFLNELPPALTLGTCPVPTTTPSTNTSAMTSYLSFRLVPFWPTQSLAGLSDVSCLAGALTVVLSVALLLERLGSLSLAETLAVLLIGPETVGFTTIVTIAEPFFAMPPNEQLTVLVPLQLP